LKANGNAIHQQQANNDLGVMAGLGKKPAAAQNAQPAAPAQPNAAVPAPAGNGEVPAAQPAPAKAQQGEVPAATAPAAASTSKH
jgi:preprotein translocase subunit SecG